MLDQKRNGKEQINFWINIVSLGRILIMFQICQKSSLSGIILQFEVALVVSDLLKLRVFTASVFNTDTVKSLDFGL